LLEITAREIPDHRAGLKTSGKIEDLPSNGDEE